MDRFRAKHAAPTAHRAPAVDLDLQTGLLDEHGSALLTGSPASEPTILAGERLPHAHC